MRTQELERSLVRYGDRVLLPLRPEQLAGLALQEGQVIHVASWGALATTLKRRRPSGTTMEGEPVPAFTMHDQNGETVTDKSLRGTPYVLYFYPKDDTPGCTKEACAIRDSWSDFEEAGVKVYGVSKDDAASHQKFIDKYDLPFDLLVADEKTLEDFGVWGEKNMYGRKFMGISRETVLVGADGTVLKHYPKVKPEEHAAQILADWQTVA